MSKNPWKEVEKTVEDKLMKKFQELDWPEENLSESLEEPSESSFGDLASTICFELPKKLKRSPDDLAGELEDELEPGGLIEKVESEGGYVNFFLDDKKLASLTLSAIEEEEENFGHIEKDGKKTVIEHTSVNPTKPLHIGHGRNSIIGDTMSKILKSQGREVEVHNYIDDLGLQVAQTLVPYTSNGEETNEKFDHFLGKLYVDFHEKAESDPELKEEARDILTEMEEESEMAEKARNMSERCVKSNLKTSDRLNIDYDLLVWESDITKSGILEETLDRLNETSYLVEGSEEKEGANVLKLEDFGIDDKVMVRSDGTAVYTAKDLAYQLWKFGEVEADLDFEFHSERNGENRTYTTSQNGDLNTNFGDANQVVNVIGVEQKYPQKVVFTALKTLGLEKEFENSHHLAYEHVSLPSEKFKGREGTWIGYSMDKVINETVSRAKKEVEKRNPEADEDFLKETAEKVGISAIRFSLIRSSPEKKVVFEWDRALDFNRNSGPAVQYSHARACSILRKAGKIEETLDASTFQKPQEYELIKKLAKFPQIVKKSSKQFRPHMLAEYAADLSLKFNKFYEVAPVLDAESKDLEKSRLRLVKTSKIVLENVLNLLGIKAPEKM